MPAIDLDTSALYAPCDLQTLRITGGGRYGSFTLSARLCPDPEAPGGWVEALDTSLTADAGGSASVGGFDSLLLDAMASRPSGVWGLEIRIGGSATADAPYRIHYCRARLGMPLSEWGRTRPLSLAHSGQRAFRGVPSLLRVTGTVTGVRLSVRGTDGKAVTAGEVPAAEADGGCSTLTLDWDALLAQAGEAVRDGWQAEAEVSREGLPALSVRYRGTPVPYGGALLAFSNAFGVEECLCMSRVTAKHSPSYHTITVGGHTRNYRTDNGSTCEGVSLPLEDPQLDQAADLTESPSVRLRRSQEGRGDVAVTPTKAALEADSSPGALPRLELTWREETERPEAGARDGRVWDGTFDDTYN